MTSGRSDPYTFAALGGIKVAVGVTSVEITTLIPGARYRFTLSAGGDAAGTQSGGCVGRFDTTAAVSSNANFDFALAAGESIDLISPNTLLNVIEMDATSAATLALYIQRLSSI